MRKNKKPSAVFRLLAVFSAPELAEEVLPQPLAARNAKKTETKTTPCGQIAVTPSFIKTAVDPAGALEYVNILTMQYWKKPAANGKERKCNGSCDRQFFTGPDRINHDPLWKIRYACSVIFDSNGGSDVPSQRRNKRKKAGNPLTRRKRDILPMTGIQKVHAQSHMTSASRPRGTCRSMLNGSRPHRILPRLRRDWRRPATRLTLQNPGSHFFSCAAEDSSSALIPGKSFTCTNMLR
jgi:hypothetical protein